MDLNKALKILKFVDPSISKLPHVLTIADTSAKIVEARDRVTSHRKRTSQIVDRVATISVALLEVLKAAEQKVENYEKDLKQYAGLLEEIYRHIGSLARTGVSKIISFAKSDETKERLESFLNRLDELQKILQSRFGTAAASSILSSPDGAASQASTSNADKMKRAASTTIHTTITNLPTASAFRVVKDIVETLEDAPYIKTLAGVCLQILEIREQVKDNKDLTDHLVDHVADRSVALLQALQEIKEQSEIWEHLKYALQRYEKLLIEIHAELEGLARLRKIRAIINRDDIKKQLQDYARRLTEFDAIFNFSRLTKIETIVRRIDARGDPTTTVRVPKAAPVPPPSKIFTGREDVLIKMGEYFDPSSPSNKQRIYVLYGLGGAGKTQIGLKFIEDHAKQFSRKHFIDASTVQSITAAFETIGRDAGLPEPVLADTLRWLSSLEEEWMLLFDNADDPSIDLSSFFPSCSHGNILVTTRNPELGQLAPCSHHNVGMLKPDEALLLLQSSLMCQSTADDKEHANLLVQELGYLALAIVQAGAYIAKSQGISFKRYREMYRTHRAELLRRKARQNGDSYAWSVYTTWEMSFRSLSTLAAQLLQVLSYWHYERIPKVAFENAVADCENAPDGWEDAVEFVQTFTSSNGEWDDFAFQEAVNELTSFSLLSSDLEDVYSMHPLVHSWARDRNSPEDRQRFSLHAGHILGLSVEDTSLGPRFLSMITIHIRSWIVNQSKWPTSQDLILVTRFADVYERIGWWNECEELELALLEIRRQDVGEEHGDTLWAKQRLAYVYWRQGRWKEAENLYRAILETSKKLIGEDHPDTVFAMANLAATYREQGRLEEAEELAVAVLENHRKVLGEEHLDTLKTKSNLVWTYYKQGKWKEAEELGVAALEGQLEVLGREHPDTLWTMSNLASTYSELGKWKEAEELAISVLETRRKVLGEEHPDTLTSLGTLALMYNALGRLEEAEDLGISTLEMQRKVLGEKHLNTLTTMHWLAWTYSKQGQWKEAEELGTAVVEKQKEVLGEHHPYTQLSMRNLAFYRTQGAG